MRCALSMQHTALVQRTRAKLRRCALAGEISVTTLAGTGAEGNADGPGSAATFRNPTYTAWFPDGHAILVSNMGANSVKKIDVASGVVTTFAGSGERGHADGRGIAAQFWSPQGIAISPDGTTVVVVDGSNHLIRKIDVSTKTVTTIAGRPRVGGFVDGIGTAALLEDPYGIDYSPDGTHVLFGSAESQIRKIDMSTGAVTTLAGVYEEWWPVDGRAGADARIDSPGGIAYSPDGSFVLVGDTWNDNIRKIDMTTMMVTTLPGTFVYPFDVDIAPDQSGAIVAGDYTNDKLWQIDLTTGANYAASVLAGNGPGSADGDFATARFSDPLGAAYSPDGTKVAVVDFINRKIRLIDIVCGEGYALSICKEIVCTQPAVTAGYTVVETELSVATGFDVTAQCDTGYEGSPVVGACRTPGDYTLMGCNEIVTRTITCGIHTTATNDRLGSFCMAYVRCPRCR